MTSCEFSEGSKIEFIDCNGVHSGIVLGMEPDVLWVIVHDLKAIFEVSKFHVATGDGMCLFENYERRRSIASVASGPPDGDIQSPFFEYAKQKASLLKKVKMYYLLYP